MDRKTVVRLVRYYFNFDERKKKIVQAEMERYYAMNTEDLDYYFDKIRAKYRFHNEISKAIGKAVMLLLGTIILLGVLIPFFPTKTSNENQIALFTFGVLVIFSLTIFIVFFLLYRKYVNELRVKMERIEKIVIKRN